MPPFSIDCSLPLLARATIDVPTPTSKEPAMSWRDALNIHPALDAFDPLSPAAVETLARKLADDASGAGVTIWKQRKGAEPMLVGGLDLLLAFERIGAVNVEVERLGDDDTAVSAWAQIGREIEVISVCEMRGDLGHDPYIVALAERARGMTMAQRRDAVARILKTSPRLSDQRIAEAAKITRAAVAAIRAELTAPPKPATEARQEPARDRRVGAEQIAEAIKQVVRVGQRQKIAFALRQAGASDIADALTGPSGTASAAGRRQRGV
jgi:hypothetical protein